MKVRTIKAETRVMRLAVFIVSVSFVLMNVANQRRGIREMTSLGTVQNDWVQPKIGSQTMEANCEKKLLRIVRVKGYSL